jgi:hypothetical protein
LQAARLLVHECERVFRDRMVNDTDMAKFDEFRAAVTKKYFEDLGLSSVEERPLLFTSFMQVRLRLCGCHFLSYARTYHVWYTAIKAHLQTELLRDAGSNFCCSCTDGCC